jgi:uncharacterized membrane protein
MTPETAPTNAMTDAAMPRGWVVWVRNKFLAGLALAAPLIVTFWILQFVYTLLHGWSEGLLGYMAEMLREIAGHEVIRLDDPVMQRVTAFVGFMIPLIVVVSLGVMATNVIGARIVTTTDKLLLRIPMVAVIYKTLKQVIDAFRGFGARQNVKRVVYIEQGGGVRMLGFATGQFTDPQSGKGMTCVLVPTSPSPMTAILLIVDSEKVTDAPISVEDSMKMILSGGLVGPQTQVPPLNQKPTSPAPVEKAPEAEPVIPMGLPRAEDFDSGDTEILTQALGTEPRSRRWLPWKKK